jgi:hypothetical protein
MTAATLIALATLRIRADSSPMLARVAAACALLAAALPRSAAGDPAAPDVSTLSAGVAGVAGFEDQPGLAAGLEGSAGYRFRPLTSWHLRGWWAPAATRMGGGGEDGRVDHGILELRTGPTWWRCSATRCLGVSAEAGVQRLATDGMNYPEDGEPYERHDRDYAAVTDGRLRYRLAPARAVSIELGFGFRFKTRLAGDSTGSRTGGGLLFSFGVLGNL